MMVALASGQRIYADLIALKQCLQSVGFFINMHNI
jgi:hypothetical protein